MGKIEDFLSELKSQAPAAGKFQRKPSLVEKVPLNNVNTFGRYNIYPVVPPFMKNAYWSLPGTREVNIKRQTRAGEWYDMWVKILPEAAYRMVDSSGRITSSLTTSDEALLREVTAVFDRYVEALGGNKAAYAILKNRARVRNYTIFFGYCTDFWKLGDTISNSRESSRSGFGALFISTASGFLSKVESSIADFSIDEGDRAEQIFDSIYSRETNNRRGYITIKINPKKESEGKGFDLTVQHKASGNNPLPIGQEFMDDMIDPIAKFLGSQARIERDAEGNVIEQPVGQARHFNAELMRETLEFMRSEINKISNSQTPQQASQIQANTVAQAPQQPNIVTADKWIGPEGQAAVDQRQNQYSQYNATPEQVQRNNEPFQTPPVAHMSPTGDVMQPGGNFGQPRFDNNSNYTQAPQFNVPGNLSSVNQNENNNSSNEEGDLPF